MSDLTTLANVKLWLPIPSGTTSEDALLTRLISATSDDFERATKRTDLLAADYTEVREGDGAYRMILYHWPINTIASLKIAGAAVTQSADRVAPGYYLDEDIDPERVWELFVIGQPFTDGSVVQIGYNAGYATVPLDIEQAVIDWVVYRYKGRPNVGVTQRKLSEGESAQVEQVDAPPTTLAAIARYARRIPSVDRRYDEMQARQASIRRARSSEAR